MEKDSKKPVVFTVIGIFVVSGILLLGLLFFVLLRIVTGPNAALPSPWSYISQYVGWRYFCAWSISFYLQVGVLHALLPRSSSTTLESL